MIIEEYQGVFPSDYDTLLRLPGIGSYTAGAILTFAFQKPAAVVDGNIARVLARFLNDQTEINSSQGKKHYEAISLEFVQKASSVLHWQEGLMEIGALICKAQNPLCTICPLQDGCSAKKANTITELPKKLPKQTRQSLNLVCAIIHNEKEIWLEKNTDSNLFKGLYAPPNAHFIDKSQIPSLLFELLKNRGISYPLQHLKPVYVKRTLTHRDLHLFGFLIDLKTDKLKIHSWFKRDQLHKIGLSTAIRALLECILDKKADVL